MSAETTDIASDHVHHLRAGGTSVVVLGAAGRLPRILSWGEDLGALSGVQLQAIERTAIPAVGDSVVTYPQPVPVVAQLHEGWLGRPGIIADGEGARWAPYLRGARYRIERSEESVLLRAEATDPEAGLALRIEIEVLRVSGLVRQRATLENTAETVLRLGGVELALPVPGGALELMDLAGRWALERVPQRREFDVGEWLRTSRGGKPGLEHALLIAAGSPGFGFRSGRVWAAHLAWSGNQTLGAERTPADTRRLVAREELHPGEVDLVAGDHYTTPWMYGSWGDGLDELAGRFHRHLRSLPSAPRAPRPVVLNTWEAAYFEHEEQKLTELAERGAALGVERFVIDDGWFRGRRDDTTSLGDWEVDREVWPRGLGPIAARVRELGMDFGLWFEPEMVNLDSELARQHPEWVFDAGHGAGLPSRQQHVLDLTHPGAYAHVLEQMSTLIEEIGIAFIKWDHNRYLLDAGHAPGGRAAVREQTLAAYALMDELHRRHPGLEIESCASGGGRIDLGVLERTQRVWPSDCNDPHERMEIQRWTSLLVPPEYQGTHIGAEHSHTTRRMHPLSYRGEKAFWGNLGIEVDLLSADDDTLRQLAAWIGLHRRHRSLLHGGRVVHADDLDPAVRVEGVVAEDASEALFALSLTERPRTWPLGRIGLPGLDDERTYRVALTGPAGETALRGVQPPWIGGDVELSGRVLRSVGLEAPGLDPDRSVLLHVLAC